MKPQINHKALQREILLSLWKIHILYHAAEKPLVGQWILHELREHGYVVSPGTLYPLLKRLADNGWIKGRLRGPGSRAPCEYRITSLGREVLHIVQAQLDELVDEVTRNRRTSQSR